MENYENSKHDIFSLEVDEYGKATFLEMARWTKFLAILGYVFIGLLLLVGIGATLMTSVAGAISDNPLMGAGGATILVMMVIAVAIYFYPVYALMRYSGAMKIAMNTNSKENFNTAITYLKNAFKYLGILMIIVLCLYGIMFVIGIAGAMMHR